MESQRVSFSSVPVPLQIFVMADAQDVVAADAGIGDAQNAAAAGGAADVVAPAAPALEIIRAQIAAGWFARDDDPTRYAPAPGVVGGCRTPQAEVLTPIHAACGFAKCRHTLAAPAPAVAAAARVGVAEPHVGAEPPRGPHVVLSAAEVLRANIAADIESLRACPTLDPSTLARLRAYADEIMHMLWGPDAQLAARVLTPGPGVTTRTVSFPSAFVLRGDVDPDDRARLDDVTMRMARAALCYMRIRVGLRTSYGGPDQSVLVFSNPHNGQAQKAETHALSSFLQQRASAVSAFTTVVGAYVPDDEYTDVFMRHLGARLFLLPEDLFFPLAVRLFQCLTEYLIRQAPKKFYITAVEHQRESAQLRAWVARAGGTRGDGAAAQGEQDGVRAAGAAEGGAADPQRAARGGGGDGGRGRGQYGQHRRGGRFNQRRGGPQGRRGGRWFI